MKCPNCGTENDPGNKFCYHCNYKFLESNSPAQEYSPGHWLGIYTIRLFLTLFGLWLVKSVLINLSYVKGLKITEIDLSATSIISIGISLLSIFLLINYINILNGLWSHCFPKFYQAIFFLRALLFVLIISLGYTTLLPVLLLMEIDTELLVIFQWLLLIISSIWLFRGAMIIFQVLPNWITEFRLMLFRDISQKNNGN